jgi:putative ABC transport system substrate-binding protein
LYERKKVAQLSHILRPSPFDRERGHQLRRRDLIALLGSAGTVWPLVAGAQRTLVVGFLHYAPSNKLTGLADAVRQGLKETGYAEGQNVVIEYRWAEGQYDRLPALAADLVHRRVDVIFAGGAVAAQAAKRATTTIPVVFTSGADPVATGLVASLGRPGGNLTGMSLLAAELATKRLELIRDLLPHARAVVMITNPAFPGSTSEVAEVETAGRSIAIQIHKAIASSPGDIDAAFSNISQLGVDAFIVGADGFFITRSQQFALLAARYTVPGIYPFPDFPEAGGLLSYGLDLADAYRQAGVYVGQILNGAKPADLPVRQPTKFELVVNLNVAKALGLTIPPLIEARVDKMIE